MDTRKVVIRKLPPNISETDVREVVDKAAAGNYDWLSFVQGKIGVKRVLHSRAYLSFRNLADIPGFKLAVEQHAFVTERGTQYRGFVEYAPFQKIPEGKVKRDPREATIEKDSDYLAFVEWLEAQPEALPSVEVEAKDASNSSADQAPQVTALMAYLQDKHAIGKGRATAAAARSNAESKGDRRKGKTIAGDEVEKDYSKGPVVLTKVTSRFEAAPNVVSSSVRVNATARGALSGKATPAEVLELEQRTTADDSTQVIADDMDRGRDAKDEKPVRVRAGFQVYQPKRLGRLSGTATDQGHAAAEPFTEPQQMSHQKPPFKYGLSARRDSTSRYT